MNDLTKIVAFLNEIGIEVRETSIEEECFLPGIKILSGAIEFDPDRLKYPGDLLHEAGHIAVTEPEIRPLIGTAEMPQSWPSDGDEIAAIVWSYAALKHIDLPLHVLFHDNGYKNEAGWLREEFTNENYIGLPLLEWMELCVSSTNASEGQAHFPTMIKWLR